MQPKTQLLKTWRNKLALPLKPFAYELNKSKLVDPENNRRLTAALFEETNVTPRIAPLFSLEEWGKVYVEIADPTDYKAAMMLLGNWEHWKMIVENQSVLPYVERWREEVTVKLKSEAVANIRKLSTSKDAAAKTMMLGEWDKPARGRGRPKEEKKVEPLPAHILDDHKRLGL